MRTSIVRFKNEIAGNRKQPVIVVAPGDYDDEAVLKNSMTKSRRKSSTLNAS
jgi:hypothetical protein